MTNKIALVTGANRGIGFTVVKQLLEKSFITILTARNSSDGEEAIEKLAGKGDLHFHQLDVNDAESIAEIKKWVLDKFGRLDVLINNAGINYDSEERASTVNLDDVKHTLETNLFGPWRMCQAFVPMNPRSSEMTVPPVSTAISSNIAFLLSPNPGALTAATFNPPFNRLITKVANA